MDKRDFGPHRGRGGGCLRTSIGCALGLALGAALGIMSLTVGAALHAEDEPSAGPEGPPDVALERLLTLPDSFSSDSSPKRGGGGPDQWRSRFREVRGELDTARGALEAAQLELEQLAEDSGNYQVSAPGSSTSETSPVSFKLREEIRTQRDALSQAEKRLRALEIEADLAEVPPSWRE